MLNGGGESEIKERKGESERERGRKGERGASYEGAQKDEETTGCERSRTRR